MDNIDDNRVCMQYLPNTYYSLFCENCTNSIHTQRSSNGQTISIIVPFFPFCLTFLLLIAYSTRNQYDDAKNIQYITLWTLFILFGLFLFFSHIMLFACNAEDSYQIDSIVIFSKLSIIGGIIIPMIVIIVDKNLWKGLLDYFPHTPPINERRLCQKWAALLWVHWYRNRRSKSGSTRDNISWWYFWELCSNTQKCFSRRRSI